MAYSYGHAHDGAVLRWLLERDRLVRIEAVQHWQQDHKLATQIARITAWLKRLLAA